jgi:hypothetical protein
MTLCIAWKSGQEVYLASDSRLTSNGSLVTNDANKIFRIKVEIYGPIPENTPNAEEPIVFQSSFGLCFAGSYINGSVLADTIEEVLTNIQAVPYSDYSIDNLSDIAFVVYKKVSIQLMNIHRQDGLSEVLFGGYCPINQNLQFYKFSPKFEEGEKLDFEKKEVEITEQATFIGDSKAKQQANSLLSKLGKNYTHFHLLREIIKDDSIATVGGNIQAGLFRPHSFKTYGIAEYSTYEDEYGLLQVKNSYTFRGISLDLDDEELSKGYLHINKTIFNPFESERQEYFKQIDNSLENNMDI